MNILTAKLYKRYKSSIVPKETDSLFSMIGHFDYLRFEVASDETLSGIYKHINDATVDAPARLELNEQDIYMFGMGVDQEQLKYFVAHDYNDLPFCVMVAIEDGYKMDSEPPFSHDDIMRALNEHEVTYSNAFDDFVKNQDPLGNKRAELRVFYTLSCIDMVLLFRTNSYELVHDFILHLMKSEKIVTSYSLYGLPFDYDIVKNKDKLDSDANLQLSIRVALERNIETREESYIDAQINKNTGGQYEKTIPAGSYHRLYSVSFGVYSVLDACLKKDGALNPCEAHLRGSIHSYRMTLRFRDKSNLQPPKMENELPFEEMNCSLPGEDAENLSFAILETYQAVYAKWESLASKRYSGEGIVLRDLEAYARAVELTISQYLRFFEHIRYHAEQGVDAELFGAIGRPLRSIRDMLQDFKCYIPELINNEAKDEVIEIYETFLGQIQTVIVKIGSHMHDLMHLQRSRLEDIGLYQSQAAATAKLSLGYYAFAQFVCDRLHATNKEDKTCSSLGNPFSFFVNLTTMPDNVTATEYFNRVMNYRHINSKITENAIIGIDIARQSLYDIQFVCAAIIHELAHFVGWRNREFRAKCILQSICKWLAIQLIAEPKSIDSASELYDFFQAERMRLLEITYEIRNEFCSELMREFEGVFEECLDNDLQWAYQSNCEEIIIRIFARWLGNPIDTIEPEDSPIAKRYVDIPALAVNYNKRQSQREGEIALEWVRREGKNLKLLFDYMGNFMASIYEIINMEIFNAKGRINQIINQDFIFLDSFKNIKLDEDECELTARTCVEPFARQDYEPSMSLEKIIDIICNTYSEIYCDLIMVKLLRLSAENYIEFVLRQKDVSRQGCWRVWLVLSNAYDINVLDETVKEKVERIKDRAGSLTEYDEYAGNYLKEIMNNTEMKRLFETSACGSSTINENANATDDMGLLDIFAHALRLRRLGMED